VVELSIILRFRDQQVYMVWYKSATLGLIV